MKSKLRVGVIFGGRSGEHEVSVASAASVMRALDPEKYDIVPIGITHEGRWLAGADPRRMLAGAPMESAAAEPSVVTAVTVTGDPTQHGLVPVHPQVSPGPASPPLDIVIPVLHGTYGEDGTLQGLLEMAGIPYAGCGGLGSALGMDKEKAKMVFRAAGLPVVDWLMARRHDMERDKDAVCQRIEERFPYPVFVKPANMALDEAIMDAVAADRSPPTLRFYQWDPPCLSLGKRQPLSGIDLEACQRDGVDVVRRATGGLAILHTDEVTYSVCVRPDDPRAEGAVLDAYRKLSQGLVAGLALLGVDAVMNPVEPGSVQNASAACFEAPSAYEITAGTQKLMASLILSYSIA